MISDEMEPQMNADAKSHCSAIHKHGVEVDFLLKEKMEIKPLMHMCYDIETLI